jgi:hypothetical protein
MHQSNVASIRRQLSARHIRIVDATGLIIAAAKAGMLQRDGIHLTTEGNRRGIDVVAALGV